MKILLCPFQCALHQALSPSVPVETSQPSLAPSLPPFFSPSSCMKASQNNFSAVQLHSTASYLFMVTSEPDTINMPTLSSEYPLLGCTAHGNQEIRRTCCFHCQRLGKSTFTSYNVYFSATSVHLYFKTPRLLGGRYSRRLYFSKHSLSILHLASGFNPEHV